MTLLVALNKWHERWIQMNTRGKFKMIIVIIGQIIQV